MKKFKQVYKDEMKSLKSCAETFPWEDPRAYAFWLGQTYYFARITTRLLIMAGAHFDYSLQQLHLRFIDHAKEERGHEKILIQDLKALDSNIERIPELTSTAGLYQSQFYWIQHQ